MLHFCCEGISQLSLFQRTEQEDICGMGPLKPVGCTSIFGGQPSLYHLSQLWPQISPANFYSQPKCFNLLLIYSQIDLLWDKSCKKEIFFSPFCNPNLQFHSVSVSSLQWPCFWEGFLVSVLVGKTPDTTWVGSETCKYMVCWIKLYKFPPNSWEGKWTSSKARFCNEKCLINSFQHNAEVVSPSSWGWEKLTPVCIYKPSTCTNQQPKHATS